MAKQLSLLPLMHQFDKEGFITDTTYWETDACEENNYYLVFNKNYYTMLLPEEREKWSWLGKVLKAQSVVITKGSYDVKKDCFEIMFFDFEEEAKDKTPFSIILQDEQFERITPLMEGRHGHLNIYVGGLYNCKNYFDKVYYRVADTLPFCKPVED